MRRPYRKMNLDERRILATMLQTKSTKTKIAEVLDRDRYTIHREIKRICQLHALLASLPPKVARMIFDSEELRKGPRAISAGISHAWPIALGPDAVQPLKPLTGQTLGTLAVWVFFAISGYLISLSFVRTADTPRFVMARVRRLMPGLIVSVLLVALILGPVNRPGFT